MIKDNDYYNNLDKDSSEYKAYAKFNRFNIKDQNIMPSDEEIEKRAEYMQRPRNPSNDIKEEFIYGYMQGADWIINKIKQ